MAIVGAEMVRDWLWPIGDALIVATLLAAEGRSGRGAADDLAAALRAAAVVAGLLAESGIPGISTEQVHALARVLNRLVDLALIADYLAVLVGLRGRSEADDPKEKP